MKIRELVKSNETKEFDSFIPTDNRLITVKRFRWNKAEELHAYRERHTEHYLLMSGEIWVDGREYLPGTILTYEPHERRNYFCMSDVCFICFTDSPVNDDELIKGEMDMDSFIEPYLKGKRDIKTDGETIDKREISVVLQGAIDNCYTPMAIKSVRNNLPGAKILLSTWADQKTEGLDVDEIVINDDPGAPIFVKVNGAEHCDNRNRLLVSTQGGIRIVSTKYTLKMRSDCILMGDGVVRNFDKYPKKTGEMNIFKKKLVVGEQCSLTKLVFKEMARPYLFHVSDWFCFGLTEDVKTFFEGTEIESIDQMTKWCYKNPMDIPEDDVMGLSVSPRYNSEQYYFISALRRHHDIHYDDVSDYSPLAEEQSINAIMNNFEILNIKDHQIINAKKENKQPWDLDKVKVAEYFTNKKYEEYYRKQCCSSKEGEHK